MTDPEENSLHRTAGLVREAIRQRAAELAAEQEVAAGGSLPDLEMVRLLEEPPNVSARPVVGPLITLWRRALKRLVLAWYVRPMIGRQNDFNQAAAARISDLVGEIDRLERRLKRLEDAQQHSSEP